MEYGKEQTWFCAVRLSGLKILWFAISMIKDSVKKTYGLLYPLSQNRVSIRLLKNKKMTITFTFSSISFKRAFGFVKM